MKQFLIFIGGFIVGILATLLFAYWVSVSNESSDGILGLTIFPEKGECLIKKKELEIFQVIKSNMALAETGKSSDRMLVLLINYDGLSYYDNQKIKIPTNKCARQIGTYQYTTGMGIRRTVAAVSIE